MLDSSVAFLHALARFRSSQPLSLVELWNQRHDFDLALALRSAFWRVEGEAPRLAIVFKKSGADPELVDHVCLSARDSLFDLLGTGVLTRLEEEDFEGVASFRFEVFDAEADLKTRLEDLDYFLEYWAAAPELLSGIEDGVIAAGLELTGAAPL